MPAHASEAAGESGSALLGRDARRSERAEHGLVGRARRRPHESTVDPPDDSVETADVVGVVVGQHEQRDSADAEPVEAGGGRLGGATDVDHRDRTAVADHQGIALPDIARSDLPARRESEHPGEHGTPIAPV